MTVADEIERLAWQVLWTVNRMQAKDSSVRLVVPRAPEVADELESPPNDAELLTVEEYLLERGYVAPANIGLTWGTYTITPAGFDWLERGLPEPLSTDRLRGLADVPGEEAAFEATLQAELEEESRRMEEVKRELEEPHQVPPGSPNQGDEGTRPRSNTGSAQEGAEPRSWWRRLFGR